MELGYMKRGQETASAESVDAEHCHYNRKASLRDDALAAAQARSGEYGEANNKLLTFGCRLNAYESEVIRQHLDSAGQENVVVVNSCAVTAEAERQVRQAIRRSRREYPDAQIVVTGCAAQIRPESFADMPEVDVVLGNTEKMEASTWQQDLLASEKVQVNDIMSVRETASHLVAGLEGKARAFLQVQNGCNHRCTFCTIPYGRGNSRSVPLAEITRQARELVGQGYKELVLTGVDISDYGKDLPGQPTLGNMMRRLLAQVPELPRLRLSSIDVAEIDNDVLRLVAGEPRLMPHLHLSLQAGDDMILKRMKRRHTRRQVLDFCNHVRELRPDVVFGADIIAGFPTEDEAMFANTLDIVNEAGLTYLHVFPYSPREGTPAAKMPQVAKMVRKQRAERLREAGNRQEAGFYKGLHGKQLQVLTEQDGRARTEHFALVRLDGSTLPSGELLNVTVRQQDDGSLCAVVEN